jgi:hypothetical protein
MKRIHLPGFIDVIKVDSAINEPANNPHIDRRFTSRRLPLNACLIGGAVKLLSIRDQYVGTQGQPRYTGLSAAPDFVSYYVLLLIAFNSYTLLRNRCSSMRKTIGLSENMPGGRRLPSADATVGVIGHAFADA